jgi:hypothetical protein
MKARFSEMPGWSKLAKSQETSGNSKKSCEVVDFTRPRRLDGPSTINSPSINRFLLCGPPTLRVGSSYSGRETWDLAKPSPDVAAADAERRRSHPGTINHQLSSGTKTAPFLHHVLHLSRIPPLKIKHFTKKLHHRVLECGDLSPLSPAADLSAAIHHPPGPAR